MKFEVKRSGAFVTVKVSIDNVVIDMGRFYRAGRENLISELKRTLNQLEEIMSLIESEKTAPVNDDYQGAGDFNFAS